MIAADQGCAGLDRHIISQLQISAKNQFQPRQHLFAGQSGGVAWHRIWSISGFHEVMGSGRIVLAEIVGAAIEGQKRERQGNSLALKR